MIVIGGLFFTCKKNAMNIYIDKYKEKEYEKNNCFTFLHAFDVAGMLF